jgi:hypothetical protein
MNRELKNILLEGSNHLSPKSKAKINHMVLEMEADDRAGRTEHINLRVTPGEKSVILARATKSGLSTTRFIVDTLLERIAKIEML